MARQLMLAVELPFVLVVSVAIGGGVGYWLDARLHTSPVFLLALGALGFAAGMRDLLRRLSRSGSGRAS
jgi:F0F1-type ATP synthase assembly protein I